IRGLAQVCALSEREEDDSRRPHARYADLTDDSPVLDVVYGHRRLVTADVERVLGLSPEKSSGPPLRVEEGGHAVDHSAPGLGRIRLENDPLGAAIDRRFHEDQEAPDVDVPHLGIARERARAPDPDASSLKA